MNRKYKKVTKFAVCCLMLLWMFTERQNVQAAVKTGTYGENITWKLENGVLTVSGKGDMKNCGHNKTSYFEWEELDCDESVTYGWYECEEDIKSVVVEEGVTSISAHAFSSYKIEKITLPSTLERIEHGAFYGCYIRRIVIPDRVTTIEEAAFLDCQYLEKVTMPKNLKVIGARAFEDCDLRGITIPKQVHTIKRRAFWHCEKLKKVDWERKSAIKTIEDCAFAGCDIKNLTIPASVKKIGIRGVSGARKIKADKKNKKYKSKDGVLFSKNGKKLVCYPENRKGTTYKIPKGVKTIGKYAFSYNKKLKKMVMPDSVKVVKEEACWAAEKLKQVRFSKKLKRVEEGGFSCYLTSLKLPDSLEYIGKSAFDCSLIKKTVTVPKNVKVLGYNSFYNMDSIQKVIIKSKKLEKVEKEVMWSPDMLKVVLPASKKKSYEKFFTKKKQGKNITFVYE